MPSVNVLMIEGPRVTDAGIAELAQLEDGPGVAHLIFFRTINVTDAGLATIGNLRNIRALRLDCPAATDSGLRCLGKIEGLETLAVHHQGPPGSASLTDTGVQHLMELPNLRSLHLSGFTVTDDGLVQLQRLRNLRHFSLHNTQVTRHAMERLERALPNCQIVPASSTFDP